jgi:LuxR family maltose regulon positive regulatory protein
MTDGLITTKISVPPARIDRVRRVKLLERLNSSVSKKLCLVSAPAGFGKTTLISAWASQLDLPLSWFSLDEGDNETDRFLLHLLSALEAIEPQLQLVESSTALRQAPGATPINAILTIVVNELDKLQNPLAIVLDDYHLIANKEIDDILGFLLEHSPEGVQIIVASRTTPALPLAKLRSRAQLLEITEKDLCFSKEEVTHFLQDVMGLELSEEDYFALEARTEGWVAGLQLAALSLEGREKPSEFIASLSGSHRYILDYLAEEVFTKLPEVLQMFLLRISPLTRFSGELCDVVVGDLFQRDWELGTKSLAETPELRSQAILEFLDDANLFVFPLDHDRKWFRFHRLFSEFLLDRLATQNPDEVPHLHQRAADWLSGRGYIVEAIAHAVSAGNVDQAADLIVGQVKPLLVRGETSTLIRWIEGLPTEILSRRPELDIALAWSVLLGDPVRFVSDVPAHLSRLRVSLGADEGVILKKLSESEQGSAERATVGEYILLLAYLSRDQGDLEKTIALFDAALGALAEHDHFIRAFALGGQASSYARAGNLIMAEQLFRQAAESGRKSGSAYAYISPKDWEATVQGLQGRLNQAINTFQTAIEHISELGGEGLPLTGHAYVGLAEILLEKNELDNALAHVSDGIQRGEQVNDADALREGYLIKARILAAMGDERGAESAIETGVEIARRLPDTACFQESQAWAAILRIAEGDIASATNWASSRGLSVPIDRKIVDAAHEIERRAFARLLLAQRKINEAETVLKSLLEWTEKNGLVRTSIEIHTLLALALHAGGNREQALRTLARALLMAEPEGFVRTFLDSGHSIAALLQTVAAHGHSPEYAKRLLKAIGEAVSPRSHVEHLTERELDVLRLVADGFTNTAIASELVIAQSTVKTHINRIYSKLGVTQRTAAVAKARKLGLIQ